MKFLIYKTEYTPHGEAFDVVIMTRVMPVPFMTEMEFHGQNSGSGQPVPLI